MRVAAFLRGINVGGNRSVKMAELRDLLIAEGFKDVSTHLQSGNILFTLEGPVELVYDRLEKLLEEGLGFRIPVILRTKEEIKVILEAAPFDPDDEDYSHQFIALFRSPIEGELPPDPPKGGCTYISKTEREVYSRWWMVNGKYEVPNPPKNIAVATTRNRRVLTAILDKL